MQLLWSVQLEDGEEAQDWTKAEEAGRNQTTHSLAGQGKEFRFYSYKEGKSCKFLLAEERHGVIYIKNKINKKPY